MAGRLVATVVDDDVPGGAHERRWEALDSRGRRVAPGVYFYRLEAGENRQTRKLVHLR